MAKTSTNPREWLVQTTLEEARWEVFRNGWPDFLIKRDTIHAGIEVKGGNAKLSPVQAVVMRVLSAAGLPCYRLNVTGRDSLWIAEEVERLTRAAPAETIPMEIPALLRQLDILLSNVGSLWQAQSLLDKRIPETVEILDRLKRRFSYLLIPSTNIDSWRRGL